MRARFDTPIGCLVVTATPRGISGLELLRDRDSGCDIEDAAKDAKEVATKDVKEDDEGDAESRAHVRTVERALTAYFAGELDALRAVITAPAGTAFQRAVWAALREIPDGTTVSYRELAVRIGRPEAVRAVGLANGRNPIPIIVPCHRVIGADRSLTGFGLGVAVKAWLLVHEGAAAPFAADITAASRVVAPASLW